MHVIISGDMKAMFLSARMKSFQIDPEIVLNFSVS